MATYSKRGGLKTIKDKKRKELKLHSYFFKAITNYLDSLANHLAQDDIEYTSDNINEYSKPFFGRDLDGLEANYLLMKIYGQRGEFS